MQETQENWVWFLVHEDPQEKKMPTHWVFLPGKSIDKGAWQAIAHGVIKSLTQFATARRWSDQNSKVFFFSWSRPFIPCKCLLCLLESQSVQSLSHVWLFETPWTAACQASLSITNSWSLLKLMSIKLWCCSNISSSVIPFSSYLQSFPASGTFPRSQFFSLGGQSTGISASASVLPMNIQGWFPLGWNGWISLQSKRLSRVFSNTAIQNDQFFATQLSL